MAAAILVPAVFVFFPAAMALAASMDLVTMTIPNRVCFAVAIGYFALAAALGVPLAAIAANLSCGVAVLAATFAMFSLGWIGGGDAKLAAATALWLGWGMIFDYFASRGDLWRRADDRDPGGAPGGPAGVCRAPRLDRAAARRQERRPLRHGARRGGLMAYPHSALARRRGL